MIIDRLGGLDPLKNVQNAQKPQSRQTVSVQRDSINVSDEARELAEAYYVSEIAASTPDVRADRIAEVKEKLKDPDYINKAVLDTVAGRIMDVYGL